MLLPGQPGGTAKVLTATVCIELALTRGLVFRCYDRGHVTCDVMNNTIQRSCLHHSPVSKLWSGTFSLYRLFFDSQGVARLIIGGSGCN